MSDLVVNVGQRLPLKNKFVKAMASAAILATVALGALVMEKSPTVAGGETRTISLYHVHTRERLTVTYMQNGRYVPSAMKQINHLLRDWRRNEDISIDPRTIDLVWELHADLGSRAPINIVCGYRSPKTNAFLKRIGRNVAKKSQHMKGKAIDFFFPDVPTAKIRNAALARSIGGVGYYRSAGGPTGFLHADSGHVRHWGPGMSPSQVAGLIRDGKKYVGKRLGRKSAQPAEEMMVASAGEDDAPAPSKKKSGGILSLIMGTDKTAAATEDGVADAGAATPETLYGDDDLANLSADASATQNSADAMAAARAKEAATTARAKAVVEAPSQVASNEEDTSADAGGLAALASTASLEENTKINNAAAASVPKPRLKPKAVAEIAEAMLKSNDGSDVQVIPASAAPELGTISNKKPSQVGSSQLAALAASESADTSLDVASSEDGAIETETLAVGDAANQDGKTSLTDLVQGHQNTQIAMASASGTDSASRPLKWLVSLATNAQAANVVNGQQAALRGKIDEVMPKAAALGPDGTGPATTLEPLRSAEGKGDALVVNRAGKMGLPTAKVRLSQNAPASNEAQ